MVSMYQVITANGPVFLDTINQTDNGSAILSAGGKTRKIRKDTKPPAKDLPARPVSHHGPGAP